MPQFFVDRELTRGSTVSLRGGDARHVAGSLRLRAGDWIVLSDGRGRSFRATIEASSPSEVRAKILEAIDRREGATPFALAIAEIRGERLEWAIQKAVELGCRRILPFHAARTVRGKGGDAGGKKLARWRTIALEAAKQSGLPFVPEIEAPLDFTALCRRFSLFAPTILFFEGESTRGLREILAERTRSAAAREGLIVIGPEGGFTAEEVRLAREAGAITASLGQQILKAETAAVAAFAISQYELRNLDAVALP